MERKLIELDAEDQAWLDSSIAFGRQLCKFYGANPEKPLSLADLDRAFKRWKEDLPRIKADLRGNEEDEKVLEGFYIAGFGCLFGTLMAEEFGLVWRVYEDDSGTGYVVVQPTGPMQLNPLAFVAKRVRPVDDDATTFESMPRVFRYMLSNAHEL